jgi:integrase
VVDSWTREEVKTLLEVVREEEPAFHPLIAFLLSTGCRKGEALGLKWTDVDFDRGCVRIRRALVRGRLGVPKTGKARNVVLSPDLAETLCQLRTERRRACLEKGWADLPEFVFCSEAGGPLDAGTGSGERSRHAASDRFACMTPVTRSPVSLWLQGRASSGRLHSSVIPTRQ